MNEFEWKKNLAELPRELAPRNDPWNAIESRIQDQPVATERPRRRFLVAGSLAASLMLAFLVGWLSGQQAHDLPTQTANPQVASADFPLQAMLAQTEAEYQAAFREFSPVGDARMSLPAETVQQIETGWAELQAIETMLNEALENDGANPFLIQKMMDLRSQQLLFLQKLVAIDQSNRRSTI